MANHKGSYGASSKPAGKQQQSDSTTFDREQLDAIATCDVAEEIVAAAHSVRKFALHSKALPAGDALEADFAVIAADSFVHLSEAMRRLKIRPRTAEALREVNNNELVMVENRLHNSYCEAAAWIASKLRNSIEKAFRSGWVGEVVGREQMRTERRNTATFIKHWEKVKSTIVNLGFSKYCFENLRDQIRSERTHLKLPQAQQQSGKNETRTRKGKRGPGRPSTIDEDKKNAEEFLDGQKKGLWKSPNAYGSHKAGQQLNGRSKDGWAKSARRGLKQLANEKARKLLPKKSEKKKEIVLSD